MLEFELALVPTSADAAGIGVVESSRTSAGFVLSCVSIWKVGSWYFGDVRVLIDTYPLQLSRAQVELSMEWEKFEDRACINLSAA